LSRDKVETFSQNSNEIPEKEKSVSIDPENRLKIYMDAVMEKIDK
jgi:hypothetical protein